MKPGQMKIYNAMVNNPEGLTFKNLTEITHLSSPSLSDYLNEFQLSGLLRKDPKTRRYMLARIYYPLKMLPNDYQKALKIFSVAILKKAKQIASKQPSPEKNMLFKKFLDASFQYFTVAVWKVIGEAIAVYGDKKENLKDQAKALRMDTIINQAFNDWVNPIASCLAVSIAFNLDLADVGEQFFMGILKEATEKLDSVISQVS